MILPYILLGIWVLHMTFYSFYRHIHYSSEGRFISHVHFYEGDSDDHSHSDEDYEKLDIISNFNYFSEDVTVLGVLDYNTYFFNEISTLYGLWNHAYYINTNFLRGPPIKLFSFNSLC